MLKPKLIEAMARALRSDDTLMLQSLGLSCEDVCGGDLKCVERGLPRCDIQTAQSTRAAHIALTALCNLRPDVAAVLRGEAVVVPLGVTDRMFDAGHLEDAYGNGIIATYLRMLAASPYAAKETPDAE